MRNRTFVHDGHCGDILASLPTIRACGGGKLVITNHHLAPGAWRPMRGEWRGIPSAYECLKPLLDVQPYIAGVEWQDHPTNFTHDLREFRRYYSNDHSLALAHAKYVGVSQIDYSPWLHVTPHQFPLKTVLFSRTQRHRNEVSPVDYRLLMDHAKKIHDCQIAFVGVEVEWQEFRRSFGEIEFLPTTDLLDVARLIAGAEQFVGNPSVLMWIAMAMGIPVIQETEHVAGIPPVFDAIIPRPNLVVVKDATLVPGASLIKASDYENATGL